MFVSAITEESPLRPVLPGIYQIARQLGLEVIVEGVETAGRMHCCSRSRLLQ